jgi:alpha-aminoadipic semialdehyde synthase
MMAVDILPASIPLDASEHFSNALVPYLENLIEHYKTGIWGPHRKALSDATIASNGRLVSKHRWLQESIDKFRAEGPVTVATPPPAQVEITADDGVVVGSMGILRKKKVLLLGSGMVAGPVVQEIARREDVQLLIGLWFRLLPFCAD